MSQTMSQGISQPMKMHPDRSTFEALAKEWPRVPVWTELLADVSTPVGIFPAVAGQGPGILLESVERSERWGRYSFVAGDPAAVLVVDAAGVHVQDPVRPLPPVDGLQDLAASRRPRRGGDIAARPPGSRTSSARRRARGSPRL